MFGNVFATFALLAIFHSYQISPAAAGLVSTDDWDKGLELVTSLKYGDDCSWDAERLRLNYTRNDYVVVKTADDDSAATDLSDFCETIIKGNYAPDLLICDKESRKCVCGEALYQALYGVNKRSLYTIENGNQCRWKLNTSCALDEEINQSSMIPYDSLCQHGSSCTTTGGEICSTNNSIQYFLRNGGSSAFPTKQRLAEEAFAGKVCTCKADQSGVGEGKTASSNPKDDTMKEGSKDADGTHVSGSGQGGRWKRYISEDAEMVNVLRGYVSGVGPTLFRI